MQTILRERFEGLTLLKEAKDGKTIYKFKGPFQEMSDVVGRANRNGRKYTKALWEKTLKDTEVIDRLKNKRMLGELDHPTDEGQIRRTSHIITEIRPDWEKGIIEGELEILDHNQGDASLLRALAEQGSQLCVSSRAYGDFLKDGCTIDPETFKLVTWDIVLDPSVPVARLNRVVEAVNRNLPAELQCARFEDKQEEQKLLGAFMDEKIMSLMTEKAQVEKALVKVEANMDNMKTLVEDKNRQIEALTKKLDETTRKFEEGETDGDKAADMLQKSMTESKMLKTENAELKQLSEEAVKQLNAMTERIEKYKEIEEDAIDTLNEMKEKVEEYEGLGDKAANLIQSLTEKVKKMKRKLRKREAIDTDGGPEELGKRKNLGGIADKGEELEDDEEDELDEEENSAADTVPEKDKDSGKHIEAKKNNFINALVEAATGVELKDEPEKKEKKRRNDEDEEEDEKEKELDEEEDEKEKELDEEDDGEEDEEELDEAGEKDQFGEPFKK